MNDVERYRNFYEIFPVTFMECMTEKERKKQLKYAEKAGMPIDEYLIAVYLFAGKAMRGEIELYGKWGVKNLDNPEYLEHLKELVKPYQEYKINKNKIMETGEN